MKAPEEGRNGIRTNWLVQRIELGGAYATYQASMPVYSKRTLVGSLFQHLGNYRLLTALPLHKEDQSLAAVSTRQHGNMLSRSGLTSTTPSLHLMPTTVLRQVFHQQDFRGILSGAAIHNVGADPPLSTAFCA